jgi:hypothetical protein
VIGSIASLSFLGRENDKVDGDDVVRKDEEVCEEIKARVSGSFLRSMPPFVELVSQRWDDGGETYVATAISSVVRQGLIIEMGNARMRDIFSWKICWLKRLTINAGK